MNNQRINVRMTFSAFCQRVASRIPEVDPEVIGRYLAEVALPPYNCESVRYWANRIDGILIRERMI